MELASSDRATSSKGLQTDIASNPPVSNSSTRQSHTKEQNAYLAPQRTNNLGNATSIDIFQEPPSNNSSSLYKNRTTVAESSKNSAVTAQPSQFNHLQSTAQSTGRMAGFQPQRVIGRVGALLKALHMTWTNKKSNVKPKQILASMCWFILDNFILLQMGTTYKRRFQDFELVSGGADGLRSIDEWRKDQQAEWNSLSTTLALLATMNAAILAITPHAPSLAFSLWLGGAGLSVCGVFVVQYFPIKAFSITDQDMGELIEGENDYVNVTLLANAVASPVVMALWAALLFLIGIIDYILQSDLQGTRYRVFAALPVFFGVVVVVLTLVLGEIIDKRLNKKASPVLCGILGRS